MVAKLTRLSSAIPVGHVRVAPLHAVPNLIRSLGGTPGAVLRALKLTEKFLEHPENVIPASVLGELLYLGAKETGCDHFGLLVGSKSGIKELGLPGKLMLLCPTVRLALDTLRKYLHLHDRAAIPIIHIEGGNVQLAYAVLDGNIHGIQQLQDGAIAIALNIMRSLLGPQWRPSAVKLMRRSPMQPQVFSSFFGVTCSFEAERSELVFPLSTLDLPLLKSDNATINNEARFEVAVKSTEPVGQDWVDLVRRTTFGMLLTGNCTQKAVADALEITPRTLNRRLERAGASYLELSDYSRYTASRILIRETGLPLGDIARLLNYSDPSSFCRAFNRWSGISPAAWRKSKHARINDSVA